MSATGDSAAASPGETAEALFSQGLDHHDREAFDEAIRCYKRATELDPGMVVAHNNLGMVYIDKGLFEEAIVELTKTCALDEGYAEAYNNLGFVYRRTGDEVKAAAFYDKFLSIESDVEDAPKIRGWLEQVRVKAGALPDVKELIAGGQSSPTPSQQKVEAAGGPDAAARKVVTAGGPDAAAVAGLPELDITGANEMPDLLAAAIEEARGGTDSLQQEAPSGAGVEGEEIFDARTLMMQPSEVQAVLGGAAAKPPSKEPPSKGPVSAGSPLPVPGQPPQPPPVAPQMPAAPAAGPQASEQESPEELCERGLGQFEKGDVEGAERTLQLAIGMNPRLAVARSTLGRVLAKAGRFDEAVAELRQAVSLDQTDAAAFYVLGFGLRELEQNEAAAEAYEHYLELTPDAAEGAQIRAWIAEVHALPQATPQELYDQAVAHHQEGQLDQALDECERVLAVDEANAEASLLLGRILIDGDDLIRAVLALKRAEPLQPDNPEVHFYLGRAYDKRGLPEDALRAYQRCVEVDPTGPNAEWVRSWLDKAGGKEEVVEAAVSRCEYCFRPFQPDQLSTHEEKKICPECMANLNIAPAGKAGLPALRRSTVDRAAAQEAEMMGRRRAKARAGRYALLATLSAVAVLLLMLMVLMSGWLSGPFQRWGVHDALFAIGLGDLLRALGADLPKRAALVVEVPPPDKIDPTEVEKNGGEELPPLEPLALSIDRKTFKALPFIEFKAQARAAGSAGEYGFELTKSPEGMEIDGTSGAIRWTPRAATLLVTGVDGGGGRFEFPRRVPVEVRVTSGEESKSLEFEVTVDFAFEPGPVIDVGVRPGDTVRLAVGSLNVALAGGDERPRYDIALAWGRYREGWLRVLYQVGEGQGAEGRFSLGRATDLHGAPSALVLADVNSDGRTDIILANWSARKLLVFEQTDKGVLSEASSLPTARGVDFLAAGDFDGDGRVDIVASHWTEPQLYVYRQEEEEGGSRLSMPQIYPTERASGWNRVIVGPLARAGGSGPMAVYLVSGSGGEPYFFMYGATPDGELEFYTTPTPTDIFPEHPLEVMPIRLGEGPPHVAALLGGAKPVLYVIGARGDNLEVVFKQEIEGAPEPVAMTVADLNGDSIDDVVILCAEELHVLLGSRTGGGSFVRAASVVVPLAVGPLAVGEFTHDGLPDIAVVLDDGRLQIVAAVHGAVRGAAHAANADEGGE